MSKPSRPPALASARPAFRPPAVAGTDAPEEGKAPTESVLKRQDLTRPSQAQAKLDKKTPAARAKAEQKSLDVAIALVSALEHLAPAIAAALSSEPTEEAQVDRLVAWLEQCDRQAEAVAVAWGASPEALDWVRSQVARILSAHPSLARWPGLISLVAALPSHAASPEPVAMDLDIAAPLALLEALAPVQRAQVVLPLGRSHPEKDLERLARVLSDAGRDAVLELLDPMSSSELRQAVFCAVLPEAGKTLAQCWVRYGQQIQAQHQARTDAERKFWVQANPDGAPLEPVIEAFQEHSARLRRLARLAKPA